MDHQAFGKALFGRVSFAAFAGGGAVRDLRQVRVDVATEIRRTQADYKDLLDAFHRVWYASSHTHGMTFYEGTPTLKNPLDLWIYGEIIFDLKPTLIVETGTAFGGSALYYARQLDRVGAGKVLSIDVEAAETLPQHPRVTHVTGSSTDPQIVNAVKAIARTHPRVMISLDSDHSRSHVIAELLAYAEIVTPGQFLVVEDTNINGRPVDVDWHEGPGPGPAVDEWLPRHPEFESAAMAERYMLTFNTWLRRTGA